jgi:hypothetical protein
MYVPVNYNFSTGIIPITPQIKYYSADKIPKYYSADRIPILHRLNPNYSADKIPTTPQKIQSVMAIL